MNTDIRKHLSALTSQTRNASEKLRDGVSDLRNRVAELKAQRDEVLSLPPLQDEINSRIDQYIEREVWLARTNAMAPEDFIRGPGEYLRKSTVKNTDALLAILGPLMADTLKRQVADLLKERPGISEQDREAKIAKIDRDMLDVELAEERIIREAEAAGFPIRRRGSANPQAVLAASSELP